MLNESQAEDACQGHTVYTRIQSRCQVLWEGLGGADLSLRAV